MSLTDDLAIIARQEATLQFSRFNEDTAWQLGVRLRQMALSRRLTLVIDVRRFGHPLFYCALPGTSPDNPVWAQRKANTVARFHRSSYYMCLELQLKGTTLADRFGLTLNEFAAHGGSFPISLAGTGVIGAVTVSGLPQRDDHQLVVEALCAETGSDFAQFHLPVPEAKA
jgi:uncharacterized protein (UPF0303 family)